MSGKPESKYAIRKSFAAALRNWRRRHKIPLKIIAAGLGVSVNTISLWELGKRFPNGRHFEMLTEYTGQTPCQFVCVLADRCQSDKCLLAKWRETEF